MQRIEHPYFLGLRATALVELRALALKACTCARAVTLEGNPGRYHLLHLMPAHCCPPLLPKEERHKSLTYVLSCLESPPGPSPWGGWTVPRVDVAAFPSSSWLPVFGRNLSFGSVLFLQG